MFWCMFACGITAFYCDILQNCTGGQVFHSENVMRIRALTCGLLQHSKIWTQNPPIFALYDHPISSHPEEIFTGLLSFMPLSRHDFREAGGI
jgi:hypothetical protein